MRFFYSDCGHLVGCDDPTFDLAAEQLRLRHLAFYADMTEAITTGQLGYRSGNPLDSVVQDVCNVVAADPSPENIRRAHRAFEAGESRHRASDGDESESDITAPCRSVRIALDGEHLSEFIDAVSRLAGSREIRLVANSEGLIMGADGWASDPLGEYV